MIDNDVSDNDQDGRQRRPWRNPGFHHDSRLRIHFGRRGFLRPEIIQLFEQEPMSGVDIMNKLQEMSHGWYRPSPGSIYPLLEQLEKEGLIAKNKDGKFELTAAYRTEVGMPKGLLDAITALESNASYLEDLRNAGGTNLSDYSDRIERLAKRIDAIRDALHSTGGN